MKPISSLKYFFLSSFSKPACNRAVYRTIKKSKATSIMEIGMGDATRAETIIQVARKFSGSGKVRYTGIDNFEAAEKPLLNLKECHKRLNRLDVKLQLVPGEMYSSLHRIANAHTRTDLLVISSGYDQESLANSWFYIPRMLHATSLVFLQDANDPLGQFKKLSRLEIERMVKKQTATKSKVAA